MSLLTSDDLNLLRARGFYAGPTGHAWYAKDMFDCVWRAYVAEDTDSLIFCVEVKGQWGPPSTMEREDFEELFPPSMTRAARGTY